MTQTGSLSSTLGTHNPLRYRGYVYDTETQLYYLLSRYYDPEIGRWINADSQLNTSLGILGLNQFSYCLNNPVNMVDYGGNKPGDLFDTMDEAAIDAAIYLGELSFENCWEYGTALYTVKRMKIATKTITIEHRFWRWKWTTTRTVITINIATQYTYKEISTLENAYKVQIPNVPLFKKTVATVHTHPMGSGKGITKFSDQDIDNANDRMIPSYVYGPNGELQKYNPANGIITVFFGLPKSPYTPWLELYNLGGG